MSENLRANCAKFVPGHLPQNPGEEFALLADWCRKYNYPADTYGAGELINSFENKIAALLGYEAGCFMPSGTMAQQIALKIYADGSRNHSFAIHPTSHLELHEQKAYQYLSNLKSVMIGDANRLVTEFDIRAIAEPVSAIILELPMREIGGELPVWDELEAIKREAKTRGFFLHMDGARLWETKAYYNKSYREICAGFDSVYVSFYKGIGALTGAMLLGSSEFTREARIWLRRFGGNLYQLHPYVASAAMRFDRALEQMPRYYERAQEVSKILKELPGVSLRPDPPQINMFHLYFNTPAEKLTEARDRLAREDKIWTLNRIQPTTSEDQSYSEIYVGEGLLTITDKEVSESFIKLMKPAT